MFTKVSCLEGIRRNQAAKNGINGIKNVSLIKVNHLNCMAKIILTISEERKKRVIDLYSNQRKTTREIAEIERMSIRDISPIIKQESFFSLLAYTQTCKYLFNIFCFLNLINKFSTDPKSVTEEI